MAKKRKPDFDPISDWVDLPAHGLQQCINEVRAFHKKHSFAINSPALKRNGDVQSVYFAAIAESFHSRARDLLSLHSPDDPSYLRLSLITEELAELVDAINRGSEVDTLDALADLIYVVVGTAVTFGLPLAEAFAEVHKSNMTKAVRKPGDTRLRDKGETYVAPDLGKVLRTAKEVPHDNS